jgi:hypothetical protein
MLFNEMARWRGVRLFSDSVLARLQMAHRPVLLSMWDAYVIPPEMVPSKHCFRENNCSRHEDHEGPTCCCCGCLPEDHSGCDCKDG